MSYSQMLEILREKNKEKIVFVKTGAFYIAIAEDAVLLQGILKLKCTCFKNYICKVGVPIRKFRKILTKNRRDEIWLYCIFYIICVPKRKRNAQSNFESTKRYETL